MKNFVNKNVKNTKAGYFFAACHITSKIVRNAREISLLSMSIENLTRFLKNAILEAIKATTLKIK